MLPLNDPAIPLSFVAGPAILANVCAILQNGVNIRHTHSVDQWRRSQAWLVNGNDEFGRLYADPALAGELSGRRVSLQLRTLKLLLFGTCVFGLTCFLSLGWALAANADLALGSALAIAVLACGATGLGLLAAVAFTVTNENRCTHRLMLLHPGRRATGAILSGETL